MSYLRWEFNNPSYDCILCKEYKDDNGEIPACETSEGCPVIDLLMVENKEVHRLIHLVRKYGYEGVLMFEKFVGEIKDIWIYEKLNAGLSLLSRLDYLKQKRDAKNRGTNG